MPVIDLGSVVGPQGPQGVQGPTGATGVQGNPGPNQITTATSTNLNGILSGNGSKVALATVNDVPTKDSAGLVKSGGVYGTRVPLAGMGRNLLDNWYFVGGGSQQGGGQFPINQRGQTSYTATGNGLDRWRLHIYNSTATAALASDGFSLSGQDAAILQIIKHPASALLGKTVTLSILVDGALYSATAAFPSTYSATSNVILQDYSSWGYGLLSRPAPVGAANAYYVAIGTSSDAAKKITAVKLELGTQQTLAHQENGAWVLNELPDYTEEWAKCNRYLRVYGRKSTHGLSRMTGPRFSHESRSGYVQCALAFDTPMADAPTVSDNGALAVRNITSGGTVADVTFSFPAPSRGSINIKAESANITAGTLYWVDTLISEGQLIISAEP